MVEYAIVTLIYICISLVCLCAVHTLFKRAIKQSNNINLKFIQSFTDVVLIVIFTYVYLSQFELTKDISKTILQSGTLLVAIATFAAQRVLTNVISGIAISASRPFNIGDKIKVISSGGEIVSEGIVSDINLRHTIIRKYDGQCDIIPNTIMDESVISNTNLIENVGNFIEIEISYDSDLDLACNLLRQIIVGHELTLNNTENTDVIVKDFSSSGIILRVLIVSKSLDDSFKACSEIRKKILKIYKENGIEIPYKTITILEG